MPNKKDVHVSGSRSDGYKVTVGGQKVAGASTQAQAAQIGTRIAQGNQSELYIHRAEGDNRGQIRERNSFGNDPHPPKG